MSHLKPLHRKRTKVLVCTAVLMMGSGVVNASTNMPQLTIGAATSSRILQDDAYSSAAGHQVAKDYNLTDEQGVDRVLMQTQLIDLNADLQTAAGVDWAGSWFDQRTDGALVVAATSASSQESLRRAVPAQLAGLVRIQSAALSYDKLSAVAVASFKYSREHKIAVKGYRVDVESNRVRVDLLSSDILRTRGVDPETNRELATALLVGVVPFVVEESPTEESPDYCFVSNQVCDPPLRGGLEIGNTGGAFCTAGLIVESNTDQKPYLLTAGHCLKNDLNWQHRYPDGNLHNIGIRHKPTYPDGGTADYGLIRINNPAGWGVPNSTVLVQSSGGSHPTPRNVSYPIRAVGASGSLPANAYLCVTGAVTGTSCGPYNGIDAGTGRGIYDVDTCNGDSGGPVYIAGKGYGIHVASEKYQASPESKEFWWASSGSVSVTCAALSPPTFDHYEAYYQGLNAALHGTNTSLP